MMGFWRNGGSGWMWAVGGVMMVGVVLLIVLAAWAVIAATRSRTVQSPALIDSRQDPSRQSLLSARQILDERYARGEIESEDYTERLQTLGL